VMVSTAVSNVRKSITEVISNFYEKNNKL